jgi:hypothetical protein
MATESSSLPEPLSDQPKRRITDFSSDQILVFYWSPSGETLGILRSRVDSDVVVTNSVQRGLRNQVLIVDNQWAAYCD